MCKSYTSHLQDVAIQVQVFCKSCASHVQVMCKSCASHMQVMCKSCLWLSLFVVASISRQHYKTNNQLLCYKMNNQLLCYKTKNQLLCYKMNNQLLCYKMNIVCQLVVTHFNLKILVQSVQGRERDYQSCHIMVKRKVASRQSCFISIQFIPVLSVFESSWRLKGFSVLLLNIFRNESFLDFM